MTYVNDKNESGLRRLMAESGSFDYQPIHSLADAKKYENGIVVFEGDYGGQIYLTCPVKFIKCTEEKLFELLVDIDSKEWNDPDGHNLYFENRKPISVVPGGMGGGNVKDELWVHPDIENYKETIFEVLTGLIERI